MEHAFSFNVRCEMCCCAMNNMLSQLTEWPDSNLSLRMKFESGPTRRDAIP